MKIKKNSGIGRPRPIHEIESPRPRMSSRPAEAWYELKIFKLNCKKRFHSEISRNGEAERFNHRWNDDFFWNQYNKIYAQNDKNGHQRR